MKLTEAWAIALRRMEKRAKQRKLKYKDRKKYCQRIVWKLYVRR